jgi:4-hydroxybenzoyl-CoA thioesterase
MKGGDEVNLRLVVDFDDVDYARVVYFARYLQFSEKAQAQVLRNHNISHKRLAEEYGIATPIIHTEFSYFSPARLDDELIIYAQIEQLTPKGYEWEYRIVNAENEKVLCSGKTFHRFIDIKVFKAAEISIDLHQIFDTIRMETRI